MILALTRDGRFHHVEVPAGGYDAYNLDSYPCVPGCKGCSTSGVMPAETEAYEPGGIRWQVVEALVGGTMQVSTRMVNGRTHVVIEAEGHEGGEYQTVLLRLDAITARVLMEDIAEAVAAVEQEDAEARRWWTE